MKSFHENIHSQFDQLRDAVSSPNGDWVIKGFIDIYKNIYTVSNDTKVISKIIELMLFPVLSQFAKENNYKIYLPEQQNHYPDLSFETPDKELIALDLKSSYRRPSGKRINGMTLGAFTGYFRLRDSKKNVTFPYGKYSAHYVLGVIYTRQEEFTDERKIYNLKDLENINSVVKDFEFIVQEKWKIASDKPGSGNTKNIGSVKSLDALINGNGTFAKYGEEYFDDYWMNYLTNDMAKLIETNVKYTNLSEYLKTKNIA